MGENAEQFISAPIKQAEKDLTLACLQEIKGRPTRKQIIEKLPPLGKVALAYNPEKDDFWILKEKYGVPLTDEDYINFVSDLFFNMLRVQYTYLGTPDNLIREAYDARIDSYKLWYTLFGFESRTYCNNKNYTLLRHASTSCFGYHLHGWFSACYEQFMGSDIASRYRQADDQTQFAMADEFFENLPYNTGRLINKLIIEATGEQVKLPYKVHPVTNGRVDISNAPFPIFVYKNVCHCIKCEQKYGVKTICDRQALVQTSKKKWVPIGIQYCQGCNKGFINQEILDFYNEKYGQILFERSYSDEEKVPLSTRGLAKDSVLSRCGYSVEKGIDKEYRQNILAYVLDSKKATKDEVQELLSFFIRFHKQANFANARQCWREDLSFVVNYKIDNQALMGKAVFKKP